MWVFRAKADVCLPQAYRFQSEKFKGAKLNKAKEGHWEG
jgi:hypothetical protein